MAVRHTIERILRDDDDASGQSVREWKIEIENEFITLRPREGMNFILMRRTDADILAADLQRAKDIGKTLETKV